MVLIRSGGWWWDDDDGESSGNGESISMSVIVSIQVGVMGEKDGSKGLSGERPSRRG